MDEYEKLKLEFLLILLTVVFKNDGGFNNLDKDCIHQDPVIHK